MKKLFLFTTFFLAMALSFGLCVSEPNPLDDWSASDQWELESDNEIEETKPLELSEVMLGSEGGRMKPSDFLRSLDDVDVQPFRDLSQQTGDRQAEIVRKILARNFGVAELQPFVFDNLGIQFNDAERARELKLNERIVEKNKKINDSIEKEKKKNLSIREKVKLDMKIDKRNIDLVFLPKEIDNLMAESMAREIGEKKSNDPEFVARRNEMLSSINKSYNSLTEQLLKDLRGRAKSLRETYKKNVEVATKRFKSSRGGFGIKWYSLPKKRKKFKAAAKAEAERLRKEMNGKVHEMVYSVKMDMTALNDARIRKFDFIRNRIHNLGMARVFSSDLNKMAEAEADMVRKKLATGGRDEIFDSIGSATELHRALRKATPKRETGFRQMLRKHESQRFLALFLKFREKVKKVDKGDAEKVVWSPNERAEIERLFSGLREDGDEAFKEMAKYDDNKDTLKKLLNKFHESSGVGKSSLLRDLGAMKVASRLTSKVVGAIAATLDDPDLDMDVVQRTISSQAQTTSGRQKLQNVLEKAKRAKSSKDDKTLKDLLSSLVTGETSHQNYGARDSKKVSKKVSKKANDMINEFLEIYGRMDEHRQPEYDEYDEERSPMGLEEIREMLENTAKKKFGYQELERELASAKRMEESNKAKRFQNFRESLKPSAKNRPQYQQQQVEYYDEPLAPVFVQQPTVQRRGVAYAPPVRRVVQQPVSVDRRMR
ncbi:hypothetical protein HOD08_02220 [bacterium]|nr:hypothetical protein [bacterium]